MENRPTIEIILPESKDKVILYAYFVNGDFKILQRNLLESIKLKNLTSEEEIQRQLENQEISADITARQEEIATKLAIKEIWHDESKISDVDNFVYNMSITDGLFLGEKIKEISANSTLSVESKKK